MPENDFEKKVQNKMDRFNLSPSADLWNKVESKIRKDKKRRFILWWPISLVLLGGGIGLAIWLANDNSKNIPATVSDNRPINPPLNHDTPAATTIPASVESALTDIKEPSTQDKPDVREKNPLTKESTPVKHFADKIKAPIPAEKKLTEGSKIVMEDRKPVSPESKLKTEEHKPVAEETKKITEANNQNQLVQEKIVDKQEEAKQEEIKTLTENIKTKKKNPKEWGIGLSAGSSAIVNNLGFGGARDYMAASPSTPAQLASYTRPKTARSLSISAQVFWKKPLSPRIDLVGAIGYQYLSTHVRTGERVDSSRLINNFYSPNVGINRFYRLPGFGNTGEYTNQFHFISLSGEISWRFTNQKTNIRWNNGLSFERLIGSSMLHYDGSIPGYYKDNSRLKKNHIFFTTAISIPVGKKFQIQPFASRSLTDVFKAKDSARSRYSNFGLQIRYSINRK